MDESRRFKAGQKPGVGLDNCSLIKRHNYRLEHWIQ